jgi:bifunctional DNA-binding transcriptional regulator/antitoxin component of YhaV-PrlF toxin-antitoxin module
MARVTSKFQVTVPRPIVDRYRIRPGDEIEWAADGDAIRVTTGRSTSPMDTASRLRLFDQATERQRKRPTPRKDARAQERGWTREDLYPSRAR